MSSSQIFRTDSLVPEIVRSLYEAYDISEGCFDKWGQILENHEFGRAMIESLRKERMIRSEERNAIQG